MLGSPSGPVLLFYRGHVELLRLSAPCSDRFLGRKTFLLVCWDIIVPLLPEFCLNWE